MDHTPPIWRCPWRGKSHTVLWLLRDAYLELLTKEVALPHSRTDLSG